MERYLYGALLAMVLGWTGLATAQNDLGEDLVLYYPLEESAGSVVGDQSANSNDGSVVGDTLDNRSVAGVIGQAFHSPSPGGTAFISIDATPDSVKDAASIADMRFGSGQSFSIACWVKFDRSALPNTGEECVMESIGSYGGPTAGNDGLLWFQNSSTGQGNFVRLYDSSTRRASVTNTFGNPDYSVWRHYVFTATPGGDWVVYRDGMVEDTVGYATPSDDIGDATTPFTLGGAISGTIEPHTGVTYDDFAVWHRALNADEVRILYRSVTESVTPVGVGALGGQPWADPAGATFGDIVTGFTYPQTETVSITNIGTGTLTLTSLTPNKGSFPGDTLTIDTSGLTLPGESLEPGESISFDVTWFPTDAVGERDMTIDIVDNAPADVPITLNGAVQPPVTEDLVIYYPFEDTSGVTITDASPEGDANHASVVGNDLTLATTSGLIGNAFYSVAGPSNVAIIDPTPDANFDAAVVPDMQFGDNATGTDFTIAGWCYRYDDTVELMGSFDWGEEGDGRGPSAGLTVRTDYSRFYGVGGGQYGINMYEYADRDAGEWVHYAYTGDRDGNFTIYINGYYSRAYSWGSESGESHEADMPWVFGNRGPDPTTRTGGGESKFDEFGVWHRALSEIEIRQIYDQNLLGITLNNVGPIPVIDVTYNFADYYWKADAPATTLTFTIANNGATSLVIDAGTSVIGPDLGQFVIAPSFDTGTPTTIYPGSSIQIPVVWTHTGMAGVTSATLALSHNDNLAGGASLLPLELSLLDRTELPSILSDAVLHYTFDETSGSVAYDSAPTSGFSNGSVVGRDMSEAGVPGAVGQAYHSPSTTADYIVIDTVADDQYSTMAVADTQFGDAATGVDFSYSFWLLHREINASQGIMGNGDIYSATGDDRNGVVLFLGGSQELHVRNHFEGPGDANLNATISPGGNATLRPLDTWSLWTVTVDRDGDVIWYFNGQELDSTPAAPGDIGLPDHPWVLGWQTLLLGSPANVELDDFAIWHRVLEPWEVEYIHLVGQNGYTFSDPNVPVRELRVTTDFGATDPDLPAYLTNSSPDPTTLTFTLRSSGLAPLSISGYSISGPDAGEFAIVGSPTPQTLFPTQTYTVQVLWTPDDTTPGTRDATFEIAHNATATSSPYEFALATQIVDVLVTLTPGDAFEATPQFSVVDAQTSTWTLTAAGGDVDITSITLVGSAEFAIATGDTSATFVIDNTTTDAFTLGADESLDLVITWDPNTNIAGVRSTTLTILTTADNALAPRDIQATVVPIELDPTAARFEWQLYQ